MLNENPKVSVLMAVYNSAKYLKPSIESILNQTFIDFEFIIIDDCSSDNSLSLLESYQDKRIKIIKNVKNQGLTKNLNKGLKIARGDYVARMDDDDISSLDRLEKQYNFMERNKEVFLCGSLGYVIDENGKRIGEKNLEIKNIKKRLLFNNQFIHSSLFFKRGVFYDESFERAQDYEFVLRIASKYKVANLEERLVEWRKRKTSLSFSSKKQKKCAIKARWLAITKYGYPKIEGFFHILLRIGQLIFSN